MPDYFQVALTHLSPEIKQHSLEKSVNDSLGEWAKYIFTESGDEKTEKGEPLSCSLF